ncbi:hypothetical protein HZA98_00370 [Candidatus Woesearchaeota archaeon]|nr:hypothetical protein [Candidatus Woesearchaeota archaeon]
MLNPKTFPSELWGDDRLEAFRRLRPEGDLVLIVNDDQTNILEPTANLARVYNISNWKNSEGEFPGIFVVAYADPRQTRDVYEAVGSALRTNTTAYNGSKWNGRSIAPVTIGDEIRKRGLQGVFIGEHANGPLADPEAFTDEFKYKNSLVHIQDLKMENKVGPDGTNMSGRKVLEMMNEANAHPNYLYPNVAVVWSTLASGPAAQLAQGPIGQLENVAILAAPKRGREGSYAIGLFEDTIRALIGDKEFPLVNASSLRNRVPGLHY